jgi:hypothetical protein
MNILIILLPLSLSIALFFLWSKYYKGSAVGNIFAMQFLPYVGLSPLESQVLLSSSYREKKISSELILLVIKGYIKIEKVVTETNALEADIFSYYENYIFHKNKPVDDQLTDFQSLLMDCLFPGDSLFSSTTELKVCRERMYPVLSDGPRIIGEKLRRNGYISERNVMTRYIAITLGVIVLIIINIIDHSDILTYISIMISGVLLVIFGFSVSQLTDEGVEVRTYLLGLKKYISVAEAERIKFHNVPEKNPQHFDDLLPYAIAFGLEKEWIGELSPIDRNPNFHLDKNGNYLNVLLIRSIEDLFNLKSFSGILKK